MTEYAPCLGHGWLKRSWQGIAQALIAEGTRVAICARGAERLAATAAQIGAEGIVTDLSNLVPRAR
jgi:NAD(P)-dependent dehydrogenase (short-subunit alcohol dehydrogenase family)